MKLPPQEMWPQPPCCRGASMHHEQPWACPWPEVWPHTRSSTSCQGSCSYCSTFKLFFYFILFSIFFAFQWTATMPQTFPFPRLDLAQVCQVNKDNPSNTSWKTEVPEKKVNPIPMAQQSKQEKEKQKPLNTGRNARRSATGSTHFSLQCQQNSLLELSLTFFPHSVISSVPRLHTRLLGASGCSTSPPLPTIT